MSNPNKVQLPSINSLLSSTTPYSGPSHSYPSDISPRSIPPSYYNYPQYAQVSPQQQHQQQQQQQHHQQQQQQQQQFGYAAPHVQGHPHHHHQQQHHMTVQGQAGQHQLQHPQSYTYYQHPTPQHASPVLHHASPLYNSPPVSRESTTMGTSSDTSPSSSPIAYHRSVPRLVKPKRKRATADQINRLNQVFEQTFFPTSDQRMDLAQELGMTPRTVQIWFQNKRQGWRSEHRRPVPREPGQLEADIKE